MAIRGAGQVWVPQMGWVKKSATEARDYEDTLNDSWALLISFWRWYPDALCDLLRSDDADYKNEELIQRVMMRAFARYKYVDITGCRGLTKTNTKFKQKLTGAVLWPGTKSSYYGPSYRQMAQIGSKTFRQLEHDYPALTKHFIVAAEGKDTFELKTILNSQFSISAFRGDNIHDVTAEEYAQEEQPAFDYEEYKRVVLPAVRLERMVGGEPDPSHISFQVHSITSAGRKQNHAYQTREENLRRMKYGDSAFVADIPWQVVILSQMRPYEWAESLMRQLTPEERLREMEARYTGADENPVIRDEALTESRVLQVMEDRHCGDPNAIYIVAYDVSYEDGAKNAKCAAVVIKLTEQKNDFFKKDKFLKSVVYIDDWPPPPDSMMQAKRLKDLWARYCMDGGQATYIVIDGWQYGKAVVENLMKDMRDGLPPLCVVDHASYAESELPGSLPVIYPVKAGGTGVTDPDGEMLRYAELEFEARNVQLLTASINEGVSMYKDAHLIKDDLGDVVISRPYLKTRALVGQIQNLKKVPSGSAMAERRISKFIQRDSWSALKYGLRFAQKLEYKKYRENLHKDNGWGKELERFKGESVNYYNMPMGATRMRGRRFV